MKFANPTHPTLTELEALMKRNSGWLNLHGTGITALPEGLSVGGWLDLRGTGIPVIYRDERNYELRRVMVGGDEWWVAGCRVFTSRAKALAHWGSDEYPDQKRGAAYCEAIRNTPEAVQ